MGLKQLQVTTGTGERLTLIESVSPWQHSNPHTGVNDGIGARKEGVTTGGFILPLLGRLQVTLYQQTIKMKLPLHHLESADTNTLKLI